MVEKQGSRGDRMAKQSNSARSGVKRWLRRTIRSVLRIFGLGGADYKPPQIITTHTTPTYILRQLERADAGSARNLATWLRVQRSRQGNDVLVVLDTLAAVVPGAESRIFKGFSEASHRVAVLEISSLGGRRRAKCLFLGDFDFVGISGLAWGSGDRYATACVRALAFLLTKEPWDQLNVQWVEQMEFYAKHYLGQDHRAQGRPGKYVDPQQNLPPPDHNFYFHAPPSSPFKLIRLSQTEPRFNPIGLARLFSDLAACLNSVRSLATTLQNLSTPPSQKDSSLVGFREKLQT